jgi:hypothetical protein
MYGDVNARWSGRDPAGASATRESSVSAATMPPMEWPTSIVRTEELAARRLTWICSHFLKRWTHLCKSPRVSNLGYVMVRTVTLRSACWRSALSWSGNAWKVSLPPCREGQRDVRLLSG